MFQTELNHWLQSWESVLMNAFMNGVSYLGYPQVYIIILVIITFGFDYKRGFILLQILFVTAVLVDFLKKFIALPRPLDVDNTLKVLGGNYNGANEKFSQMGAKSFWGNLPNEVVDYYRDIGRKSFGLPSGHMAGVTTFWLTSSLAFQKKLLWLFAILMVMLTPISRIYLGKHFLADVLAGLVLGGLVVIVSYFLILKPEKFRIFEARKTFLFGQGKSYFLNYLLVIPIGLIAIPQRYLDLQYSAMLLGVNLGFILLAYVGLPSNQGKLWQRILRVMLAIFLYFASYILLKSLSKGIGIDDYTIVKYIRRFLATFILSFGAVMVGYRFKLFEKEIEKPFLPPNGQH